MADYLEFEVQFYLASSRVILNKIFFFNFSELNFLTCKMGITVSSYNCEDNIIFLRRGWVQDKCSKYKAKITLMPQDLLASNHSVESYFLFTSAFV